MVLIILFEMVFVVAFIACDIAPRAFGNSTVILQYASGIGAIAFHLWFPLEMCRFLNKQKQLDVTIREMGSPSLTTKPNANTDTKQDTLKELDSLQKQKRAMDREETRTYWLRALLNYLPGLLWMLYEPELGFDGLTSSPVRYLLIYARILFVDIMFCALIEFTLLAIYRNILSFKFLRPKSKDNAR